MKRANILIIDKFNLDILAGKYQDDDILYRPDINDSELLSIIHKYDVLIISTRISITRELIQKANNLKLIVRMGAGVDHIDLKSCREYEIVVCNTPNSNVAPVTEYVIGQIIDVYRNFSLLNQSVIKGTFREGLSLQDDLSTKTIGIIGVGRIGSRLARIAKSFGMQVLGNDPYLSDLVRSDILVDKWVSIDELASFSDIVSLHVPLTDETEYMIDRSFFDKMKKGSILVNSSRGKVLKFEDAIAFAKEGKIRKFVIDVFENEPFRPRLNKQIANYFHFSPHLAAYTKESMYNRSLEAIEEVDEFYNKKMPHGMIDFDKGY